MLRITLPSKRAKGINKSKRVERRKMCSWPAEMIVGSVPQEYSNTLTEHQA